MSIRLWLMVAVGTLWSMTSQAEPITWTMDGVVIGGTTVTGSFVYDADAGPFGTFSDISITTTGGGIAANTTWATIALFNTSSALLPFVDSPAADETGADLLDLFLMSPMTDAGGYDPITMAGVGTCAVPNCLHFSPYSGEPSFVSYSGGIESLAVPEPASSALFGLGLAGLIFARRRNRGHPAPTV